MNLSSSSRACVTSARLIALFTVAFGLLFATAPAFAQIFRATGSVPSLYPGMTMRGSDAAYDPVHSVYLVVVAHGPVFGVFVNTSGVPVTAPFTIMDGGAGFAHFPHVEYSPHINNGVGGSGGFLVTWNHNVGVPNYVFGRLVSFPSPARVLTDIVQIADGAEGGVWHETGPAMAYSMTSQRFLVAWRTVAYGIRGRYVGANGVPIGNPIQFENAGGARDPGLAWNPSTNEFGLVYTAFNESGGFTSFRRISVDGGVSARTAFGFSPGTYATGIDVNTSTGQYVLAWALHPGTMSATFDAGGNMLGTNFVTSRFGYDQSLGLTFNGASGTFLTVGSDGGTLEVAGAELRGGGMPHTVAGVITDGAQLGSFYPLSASRAGVNQWMVVYSRDFKGATDQVIQSATTGGGGPSTYGGAGGGSTPAPPSPPPPSGGCSTPDPFVAIGGGTCINGGWVPRGSNSAPPPPPAPPPPTNTGCSTPDPFVSIGGGTCINGGWVPGSSVTVSPPPPPPPPANSGCSTPDPFVAIGGGTCVNGGWIPGRSSGGSSSGDGSCSTPDPFVSIGGGVCENGGWKPRTILCTGPDPFVSIGGGVCIGTAWLPKGS